MSANLQTRDGIRFFLAQCRPRTVRDLRSFAESEIRLPDGPDKGLRFSVLRQPYTALWFAAHAGATGGESGGGSATGDMAISGGESGVRSLESGGKTPFGRENGGLESPPSMVAESLEADCSGLRIFITLGPTQSGKTLSTLVIPAMWHLFEWEETVCCLVPDESMVNDKWKEDFLPAIRASRYANLLPTTGEGSRNGKVQDAVRFKNGVTLKFLTGGGDDKSVAGFTSRVLLATEINKFGKMSAASAEGNRWAQALGRLRAYGDRAVVYGECTVDTEAGLVWMEYQAGTGSRIAMPCGYCGDYVTLGREQLVGWQQARTEVQAAQLARWCCPSCGVIWAPGDRELFSRGSVLVHRGQEVRKDEG